MRLDQYLVSKFYAESRTKAQELIKSGCVQIKKDNEFTIITNSSYKITEDIELKLQESEILKYVSRSGLKLEKAILKLNINVSDLKCLDVGSSTGGFSECLLRLGAGSVVGFDVGRDQIHPKLLEYPNFKNFESLHVKDLKNHSEFSKYSTYFDLVVVDVSFISLEQVLEPLMPFMSAEAQLLALVKPQFELGQKFLKKGLVKPDTDFSLLESKIKAKCSELSLKVIDYLESQVPGKEGNKEFFVYAVKN